MTDGTIDGKRSASHSATLLLPHLLHKNAAQRVGYEDDRPVLILLSKVTHSNSLLLLTFPLVRLTTKLLSRLIAIPRNSI
jgi:hypothetical protein